MKALEAAVSAGLGACSVARGSALLVAVSGGPDSTALLRALCALREPWRIALSACTVDHGIRPRNEIEEDLAFAVRLCRENGVPLEIAVVPAGLCRERAREQGRSLEEVAREARHGLLRSAARSAGCSSIALGHTEDDAVETLLMRVIQGSDAGGLAGMAAVRGPFIRPLLGCSRRQVIDYLTSLSQGWREDPSNSDARILRNRVRCALLPVLEREFPGYRTGLFALSAKAGMVSQLLRAEGDRMGWKRSRRGFSILRSRFLKTLPAVRAASLLSLYDSLRAPSPGHRTPWHSLPSRLPWRFVAPALVRDGLPAAGAIISGHGVQLSCRGNRIYWERCIVSSSKKGYFIEASDAGSVSIPGIGVRVDLARVSEKWSPEAGETVLLSREIVPPLVLRSRRAGDQIILESGTTPLKELFTGWKVSTRGRQLIPLLVDRKGVVAVLGGAVGLGNRVRAGARALSGGESGRIVVSTCRNLEEDREQQQRQS